MSKRARIVSYGSSVVLVLVGSACAAIVAGLAGQVLAMVLIGSGLVVLTGLVFMEVGLSEDRERERQSPRVGPPPPPPALRRLEPTRPTRLRGHRHER